MKILRLLALLALAQPAIAADTFYRANGDTSVTLSGICVPELNGEGTFAVDFNTASLNIVVTANGNGVNTAFTYTGGNIDDYDGTQPAWGNPAAAALELEAETGGCITLHLRDEVFAVASATEWNIHIDDGQTSIMDWTVQVLDAEAVMTAAINAYDPPTNTEFENRTLLAGSYFDPANDAVANVTSTGTTTNLINLPSIPANWLTGAGIAAGAMDGKGDWNIGKTGYSLTQAFPANFPDLSITATTGRVDIDSIAGTSQTANDNGADINGLVTSVGAPLNLGGGATLAANNADIAGSGFVSVDDSNEALRNRGDIAWITGGGGADPSLLQSTDIATLASQTEFTLTAGSADDAAYAQRAIVIVTDQSTSTQKAIGRVCTYTGASRTVSLCEDPGVFTMAVGDTVDVVAATSFADVIYWLNNTPTALVEEAALVDAFHEEPLSEHTTAGTTGERLGRIPNAAAGGNGGLPTVDASNRVAGVSGNVAGSVGSISGITFPNNFGSMTIAAGGSVDALVQGMLDTVFTETTAGRIANNQSVFWDNSDANTTNTVDDVGGVGGSSDWSTAERNQIRNRIGIDGTSATPSATPTLATAAAQVTAQNDLNVLTGSDGATLATAQPNYTPATAAALATAQADLDVVAGTDGATLATAQANYAPATAAAVAGLNDLDEAGVRGAVGLASPNLDTQLAALPTAAENRDAVMQYVIENGLTFEQVICAMAAQTVGESDFTAGSPNQVIYSDHSGTDTRVTVQFSNNDRTSIQIATANCGSS